MFDNRLNEVHDEATASLHVTVVAAAGAWAGKARIESYGITGLVVRDGNLRVVTV